MGTKFLSIFLCVISLNGLTQVKDLDGNKYKIVKIGDQVWCSENLSVSRFRNGDTLMYAKSKADWAKASATHQPAWCYYEDDSKNEKKYGKLYNWYAVSDPRGLAPTGYHIPTFTEFQKMSLFLDSLGNKCATKAKANKLWEKEDWYEHDPNGTNESGFAAIPGGGRLANGEIGYGKGYSGYWWCAEDKDGSVCCCFMQSSSFDIVFDCNPPLGNGFSIRFIKD